MTYEQITGLLDRGFTPEQILQLQTPSAGTANNEAEPEKPPEEKPTTEEAPGEAPEGADHTETDQAIAEMQKTIDDLKKQIQAQNIKTASVAEIPGADESAVESVLASMIRPPFDDRENNIGGTKNVG